MRCAFHCSVVNGILHNCYSLKDTVLKYAQPRMQPGTKAIGIQEILVDTPEDADGSIGCKKPLNVNVSEEAGDHGGYAPNCPKFLPIL